MRSTLMILASFALVSSWIEEAHACSLHCPDIFIELRPVIDGCELHIAIPDDRLFADLDTDDLDYYRVYSSPEELHTVKERLEAAGLTVEAAQMDMEPSSTTRLEGKAAQQMIRLMNAFDDHDDVQNVWANFDIDDELLAEG